MDLTEYARAKFELAGILRSAAAALRERRPDTQAPFTDLFARLAEDRFNLVVVGRFSRGKTSLMNAMLYTERLPTGIVPLTSVITTVSYGSAERAFIEHEGWSLPQEIGLDALPDYVTQQGNPGNRRHVAVARVELPADLLRRGFHFVDTPGLGSSIVENTRTTERFLPEADAFILVTSYDSPLSEEELRVLQGVAKSSSQIFLVVNKQDAASDDEHARVMSHMRDQARDVFGDLSPQIYSVSAREAIEATRRQDAGQWAASGIPELRDELTHFMLHEKQAEFLLRMCERVGVALREVPDLHDEIDRLRSLHHEVAQHRPNAPRATFDVGAGETHRFLLCPICAKLEQGVYEFLCKYQYDISVRRDLQATSADRGGLCPFHTWQYEAIASPHGTCTGFSGLLERIAGRLRDMSAVCGPNEFVAGIRSLRPTAQSCDICRAHTEIEQAGISAMAITLQAHIGPSAEHFAGLCVPHLQFVVEAVGGETARALLVGEANVLERVSEDMRRYALKQDGIRRYLASTEEVSAARRALMLLAGHRNVSGLSRLS
jgi:small GTP-binding protein